MSKEVIAYTHLFSSNVASSATSRAQSYSNSSSYFGEASLTTSAEADYLHPLLEVEASEGFGSRDRVKSY